MSNTGAFVKNLLNMRSIASSMVPGATEVELFTLAIGMQANWLEFEKQEDEILKNERHYYYEVYTFIEANFSLNFNDQEKSIIESILKYACEHESISDKQWKLLKNIISAATVRDVK